MKDHYAALGLAPAAKLADIKAAYRKWASAYHPDKNGGDDTAAKFRAVQEAYEQLSDADKHRPEARQLLAAKGLIAETVGRIQKIDVPVVRRNVQLTRAVLDAYSVGKTVQFDRLTSVTCAPAQVYTGGNVDFIIIPPAALYRSVRYRCSRTMARGTPVAKPKACRMSAVGIRSSTWSQARKTASLPWMKNPIGHGPSPCARSSATSETARLRTTDTCACERHCAPPPWLHTSPRRLARSGPRRNFGIGHRMQCRCWW